MIATFARLPNREWGVRVEGSLSETRGLSGCNVTVARRSGEVTTAVLGNVHNVEVVGVGRAVALYSIRRASAAGRVAAREERVVTVTDPGVYETPDGEVFIVKPNRARTSLYAKRLVEIGGQRATEAGTRVEIEFEYAPGAIYRLTPEMRMPLERARELTIIYGRCIVCGRTLRAAESVERGIGPVCIRYFGPQSGPAARRSTEMARLREARSEASRCVDCGNRVEVAGKSRCIECNEYHEETLPVAAEGMGELDRSNRAAALAESEEAERREAEHDRAFAAREREQETAAFLSDPMMTEVPR